LSDVGRVAVKHCFKLLSFFYIYPFMNVFVYIAVTTGYPQYMSLSRVNLTALLVHIPKTCLSIADIYV